jgi:hypothetical protein
MPTQVLVARKSPAMLTWRAVTASWPGLNTDTNCDADRLPRTVEGKETLAGITLKVCARAELGAASAAKAIIMIPIVRMYRLKASFSLETKSPVL